MNPVGPIQNLALSGLAQASQSSQAAKPAQEEGFGDMLMDVLKEVNDSQQQASEKETDFMTGRRKVDYQDLMISMEKASTALQLTATVRDNVLQAYQQISSMQV